MTWVILSRSIVYFDFHCNYLIQNCAFFSGIIERLVCQTNFTLICTVRQGNAGRATSASHSEPDPILFPGCIALASSFARMLRQLLLVSSESRHSLPSKSNSCCFLHVHSLMFALSFIETSVVTSLSEYIYRIFMIHVRIPCAYTDVLCDNCDQVCGCA